MATRSYYSIPAQESDLTEAIRRYWNFHIHDLAVVEHPVGTRGFFEDLETYRFDKLKYLATVVDFRAYRQKSVLEIGCGVGIDSARFAERGARVIGIDLSEQAVRLAEKNFQLKGLDGDFEVMNGENLQFSEESFDLVYAHGVLPYAADPQKIIREIRRVLKPGGEAILMVYNRYSWLAALARLMNVSLEHQDAPVLRKFSVSEFKALLAPFSDVRLVVERFPVRSRLHAGWKGFFYNTVFVEAVRILPRAWIRPFGWHILAFVEK